MCSGCRGLSNWPRVALSPYWQVLRFEPTDKLPDSGVQSRRLAISEEGDLLPPLRKWQTEALAAWSTDCSGIAKVVTGAGKTVFGLACYERARAQHPDLRLLVVVPSIPLLDQWTLEARDSLGLDPHELATHGGGQLGGLTSRVNIAVLNTARNLSAALTRTDRWMLIADECHRAASPENRRALKGHFTATLGLSATPERQFDDFFETVLEPSLGKIVYSYSYLDALRDRVLVPFSLENYKVPLSEAERAEIDRLTRSIARAFASGMDLHDERVRRLLIRRAQASQRAQARIPAAVYLANQNRGRRGIVFHESIAAANHIQAQLERADHRVALYHSGLAAPTRLKNLRMFRTGQVDLLVACRALDEGLDVPDAEIGIIAASTSSIRQRIQRLGRVLRPSADKASAEVFTLYALDSERSVLEAEANQIEGLAAVRWYRVDMG